jgi:hypothetical protein
MSTFFFTKEHCRSPTVEEILMEPYAITPTKHQRRKETREYREHRKPVIRPRRWDIWSQQAALGVMKCAWKGKIIWISCVTF